MPLELPPPTANSTVEPEPTQAQDFEVPVADGADALDVTRAYTDLGDGLEGSKRTVSNIYDILQDRKSTERLSTVDALELVNAGHVVIVLEYIDRFTDIDMLGLAVKMIDLAMVEEVVDYIELFQGDEVNGLLKSLLEAGYTKQAQTLLCPSTPLPGEYIGKFSFEPLEILLFLDCFCDIPEPIMRIIQELTDRSSLCEYPRNAKSSRQKDAWYGDTFSDYVMPGLNRHKIGRFIRGQEELNATRSRMKDIIISMSTLVNIPRESVDIKDLLVRREQKVLGREDVAREPNFDLGTERDFFVTLINSSVELRQRLLLSRKPSVMHQYFGSQSNYLLYQVLLTKDDSGTELYKRPDLTLDSLFAAAIEQTQALASLTEADCYNGIQSPGDVSAYLLVEKCHLELRMETHDGDQKITEILSKLKTIGHKRERHFRDVEDWLLRHSRQNLDTVTEAWTYRTEALYNPEVSDTANEIIVDGRTTVFLNTLLTPEIWKGLVEAGVNIAELVSEAGLRDIKEIARFHKALYAFPILSFIYGDCRERQWDVSEKRLPGLISTVSVANAAETETRRYRLEILPPDDVRGFTIGYETGCCMTVDGAAQTCIKEGYLSKDAGFMAVYAEDDRNKLVAQSFWYVNPDYPDTLVLDSIEATEGRDLNLIVTVYQAALSNAIKGSAIPIKKVNIGLIDGHKLSWPPIDGLVPPPDGVYSDAADTQWRIIG